MHRLFLLFIAIFMLSACNHSLVHSEYVSLKDGVWKKTDTLAFALSDIDTSSYHHVFLNLRNDERYEFSNLFLILEMEAPSGNTKVDTLEYEMALPTGEWLGKGMGGVKENKLWYKENVVFEENGVYTLSVIHAMRKNGEANGIEDLAGITDVGIEIEKVK